MNEQPNSMPTLASARADGTLRPLERMRLRAQLGLVDEVTAADVRRAVDLLLHRIFDYYQIVQYTGPGYVYGRVESSYPSALYAQAKHNYTYGGWYNGEMSPVHPTCTIGKLELEAGWLCLDTAARLAVAEMALEVPEAERVLRQARYAIESLAEDKRLSGVNWADSRRRRRTPGIRKLLSRLIDALPSAAIGIGAVRPVILHAESFATAPQIRNVRDWSMPAQTAVAA